MDDKGSTVISVFGLPPVSHEDDAVRGVKSAARIVNRLKNLGYNAHIGITTGMAFCGVVGSRGGRREYSVLGDTVNLSARLMQHAVKSRKKAENERDIKSILVDARTQRAAKHQIVFSVSTEITVKGKKEKIKIFEPKTNFFLIQHILPHDVTAEFEEVAPLVENDRNRSILKAFRGGFGIFKKNNKSVASPFGPGESRRTIKRRSPHSRASVDTTDLLGDINTFSAYPRARVRSHVKNSLSLQGSNTLKIIKMHVRVPGIAEGLVIKKKVSISTVKDLIEEVLRKSGVAQSKDYNFILTLRVEQKTVQLPLKMKLDEVFLIKKSKVTKQKEFSFSLATEKILGDQGDQMKYYEQLLLRQLETFQAIKYSRAVLIEGYMGLGKSLLLYNILQSPGITKVTARGDSFDYSTPFNIWINIFKQMFQKEIKRLKASPDCTLGKYKSENSHEANVHNWRQLIESNLKDKVDAEKQKMDSYAPILNEIFPGTFDEKTVESKKLEVEKDKTKRFKYLHTLLLSLLKSITREDLYVIAIDDGMYLDEHSWNLCHAIARDMRNIFLIIASRPMNILHLGSFQKPNFSEYKRLQEDDHTYVIRLHRHTPAQIEEIINISLDADRSIVPHDLYETILKKVNGNPLFTKELVVKLKQKKCIMLQCDQNNRAIEVKWDPSPLKRNLDHYKKVTNWETTMDHLNIIKKTSTFQKPRRSFKSQKKSLLEDVQEVNQTQKINYQDAIPTPHTIHSFYGSTLDRLSTVQSMILKTAVFLGEKISYDMIRLALPLQNIDQHKPSLEEEMCNLVRLAVFETHYPNMPFDFELHFSFLNTFQRDVARSRMLSDQVTFMEKAIKRKNIMERKYINVCIESLPKRAHTDHKKIYCSEPLKFQDDIEVLPQAKMWDFTGTVLSRFARDRAPYERGKEWRELHFSLFEEVLIIWSADQNIDMTDIVHLQREERLPYLIIFLKDSEAMEPEPLKTYEDHENNKSNQNLSRTFGQKDKVIKENDDVKQYVPYTFIVTSRCWSRMGNYHSKERDFTFCAPSKEIAYKWKCDINEKINHLTNKQKKVSELEEKKLRLDQKSIRYSPSEKAKLAKHFMETYPKDKAIILDGDMSMQKHEGNRGLGSWKTRYTTLISCAILFYKKKNDVPVQVCSLSLGQCSITCEKNKHQAHNLWIIKIECSFWLKYNQKKNLNSWTHRSFVIGCQNQDQQLTWFEKIQGIIAKHRQLQLKKIEEKKKRPSIFGGLNFSQMKHKKKYNPRTSKSVSVSLKLIVDEDRDSICSDTESKTKEIEPSTDTSNIPISDNTIFIIEEVESFIHRIDNNENSGEMTSTLQDAKAIFLKILSHLKVLSSVEKKNMFNFAKMIENCDINAESKQWLTQQYTKKNGQTDFDGISNILASLPSSSTFTIIPNNDIKWPINCDGLNEEILELLHIEQLKSWDWNIFEIKNNGIILLKVIEQIFTYFNFFEMFGIDSKVFQNFCAEVREGYHNNPYHNFEHGIDVLQTVFVFLTSFECTKYLTPLEQLSILISALCHDIQHPGFSNEYQSNAETPLAQLYTDQSVLERHHAASTLKILKDSKNCNIFQTFSREDYKLIRKSIVEAILATDTTRHFELLESFNSILHDKRILLSIIRKRGDNTTSNPLSSSFSQQIKMPFEQQKSANEQPIMLNQLFLADAKSRRILIHIILHSSGISNSAKPWEVSTQWNHRVLEEFFKQGDLEKSNKLSISPENNRNMNSPQFFLNFIDFIATPLFLALRSLLPHACISIVHLAANRRKWHELCHNNIITSKLNGRLKEKAISKWNTRSDTFCKILLQESDAIQRKKNKSKMDHVYLHDSLTNLQRFTGANQKHGTN